MPAGSQLKVERLDVRQIFEQNRLPVIRHRLSNGLRVVLVEDHTVPLAAVSIYYMVGSRNESYGITGISHFLEHMMFKGTEKLGPEEMSNIISSWGGADNASTGKDITVYWSLVPSARLESLLEMEADRMKNAVFRQFESEKAVVIEERRLHYENNPYVFLMEEIDSLAIQAHPYRHPVIGWMSDIEKFTPNDLERHYRTYYSPNNAILVIAGDFEPDRIMDVVQLNFGDAEPSEPPPVRTQEPPQKGERRSKLRRPGAPRVWAAAFHIPEFTHPDYPAVLMASMILNSGRSSRLYRKLVEPGLATEVDIVLEKTIDPFLIMFWAIPAEGVEFQEMEDAILGEVESLVAQGISDEEYAKVLNNQVTAFAVAQQTVSGKCATVGEFEAIGGENSYESWIERLANTTPEQIIEAVRRYFVSENRTVVTLEPGGEK